MILLCRRNVGSAKLIHCFLWWQITYNDWFLMICQKVHETECLWASNCQKKLLWMVQIESIYYGSLLSLTAKSDGVHFTLGNSSFPYMNKIRWSFRGLFIFFFFFSICVQRILRKLAETFFLALKLQHFKKYRFVRGFGMHYEDNKAWTTIARKKWKWIFVNRSFWAFNTLKCHEVVWFVMKKPTRVAKDTF